MTEQRRVPTESSPYPGYYWLWRLDAMESTDGTAGDVTILVVCPQGRLPDLHRYSDHRGREADIYEVTEARVVKGGCCALTLSGAERALDREARALDRDRHVVSWTETAMYVERAR